MSPCTLWPSWFRSTLLYYFETVTFAISPNVSQLIDGWNLCIGQWKYPELFSVCLKFWRKIRTRFGKMFSLLWLICDIIGLIFIVANDQILINNLTIWAHWLGQTLLSFYDGIFQEISSWIYYVQLMQVRLLCRSSKNSISKGQWREQKLLPDQKL